MSKTSTLLIEAPVGRHFAHLHNGLEGLVKAASLFIETGLRRGTGVVLIASAPHTEEILEHLRQKGLEPEKFRNSSQLNLLNAETTLTQFMRGGMPDWADFCKTIGTALKEVRTFGPSVTRVYGEMVNILWREGCPEAAIRLEEYWNALARLYRFSLFCGFMLDNHHKESYASLLYEVGRTHSDVVISTAEAELFRRALDAACNDILGTSVTQMMSFSGQDDNASEDHLSNGQQAALWIMRHKPDSSIKVLELARRYYQDLYTKANSQTNTDKSQNGTGSYLGNDVFKESPLHSS